MVRRDGAAASVATPEGARFGLPAPGRGRAKTRLVARYGYMDAGNRAADAAADRAFGQPLMRVRRMNEAALLRQRLRARLGRALRRAQNPNGPPPLGTVASSSTGWSTSARRSMIRAAARRLSSHSWIRCCSI